MLILIKILTNKWTYILLLILFISIVIAVLNLRINNYKGQVNSLNVEIENLKISNTLVYKENIFKQEQIRLLNTFSKSTIQISKLSNKELNTDEKNIIISINTDFYNFMQHHKTNSNTAN